MDYNKVQTSTMQLISPHTELHPKLIVQLIGVASGCLPPYLIRFVLEGESQWKDYRWRQQTILIRKLEIKETHFKK